MDRNAKSPQEQYQISLQRRYNTEIPDPKEDLIEDAAKIRKLFGNEPAYTNVSKSNIAGHGQYDVL